MSAGLASNSEGGSVAQISHRVNLLIYVSLGLSIAAFACSMAFFGLISFWLTEAGLLFTIIHHSIILHNRKKLRKQGHLHQSESPFPVSSKKPMILMAWFTAIIYTAAFGVVMYFVVVFFLGYFEVGWESRWIAPILELVCLVVEVPLMVAIAIWCMRERRAIFGVTEMTKWYHLPQYHQA
ncbi:hypothetical protein P691DRAFT_697415 [Macrolepiota fuliginosa MF-IS2]|uniref:Uncharacterized protein n=1 Tax=Macrolepiota fuliginosa MF-IS2 TaxID=1400762 RepID=A0A9P6C8N2_9AGAR|nr:hypothetical protein P691DRAFT_697415 [Macrolepiota fuliginosa MF-IS2]